MIYFKVSADMISSQGSKNNLEKLQESLRKFEEADKELERVCKELGIPKPELVML